MFEENYTEDNNTESTLEFNNSPGMYKAKADREAVEAKDRKVKERFHREMQIIKETGPLDRTNEAILTEEDEQIQAWADAGELSLIYDRVMRNLGRVEADKEDFETVERYFKLAESREPELIDKFLQMAFESEELVRKITG